MQPVELLLKSCRRPELSSVINAGVIVVTYMLMNRSARTRGDNVSAFVMKLVRVFYVLQ